MSSTYRTAILIGTAVAVLGSGYARLARADTVLLNDQLAVRKSDVARPTRGATMAAVESKFGAPQDKHAAVGTPPITRWDYPSFAVFFEKDRVIDAVLPPPAELASSSGAGLEPSTEPSAATAPSEPAVPVAPTSSPAATYSDTSAPTAPIPAGAVPSAPQAPAEASPPATTPTATSPVPLTPVSATPASMSPTAATPAVASPAATTPAAATPEVAKPAAAGPAHTAPAPPPSAQPAAQAGTDHP